MKLEKRSQTGRPKVNSLNYNRISKTFRLPVEIVLFLRNQDRSQAEVITEALVEKYGIKINSALREYIKKK